MALSTQPYKGSKDLYPEDKLFQNWMFDKWREVLEKFGYEEYDAPILEPTELFLLKGNEEIIAEQTYTFTDRGKRSVTVRTEMTPSVSRMIASKRQEIIYPARWYSIPNIWRYERPQKGRGRSFWQLNVDLFGVETTEAEHEIITIADQLMQNFGAKRSMYEFRFNSRKFVDYVLRDFLGFDEVEAETLIRLIDKKDKLDHAEFVALLEASVKPAQREAGKVDLLIEFTNAKDFSSLPDELKNHNLILPLKVVIEHLRSEGMDNLVFDASLMRGFDYYTDIVFEVFDKNPDNNRSMFGGGRYDGLIGSFGVEPLATIGFGMGDMTFENFLSGHGLIPNLNTDIEVYVIYTGEGHYYSSQNVLKELRAEGVKVAVDLSIRKVDKQLKSAIKKKIPFALFIGQEEIDSQKFTLKNLSSHEETKLSCPRIVSTVKDFRLHSVDDD